MWRLPRMRVLARSQTPRRDVAFSTALLAIGLLEAAWVTGRDRPLALMLVIPLTIPFRWRTSHPSAAALVVTGAIVVQVPWMSLRIFDQTFVGFVCVVLVFYSLGRHGRGPSVMLVVVGCALAFAAAIGGYDRSPGSFVLALLLVGAATMTGRVVAERSVLRDLLDHQADALRQSADVAELTRVAEVRGRIAGEVHDLVSRRVQEMVDRSVEARRLLGLDGVAAARLVAEVEQDGRDALDEMRSMLGVLRSTDLWCPTSLARSPDPVEGARPFRWLPLPRLELMLPPVFAVVFLGESLLTPGRLPLVSLSLLPPVLGFLAGARLAGWTSVLGLALALLVVTTLTFVVFEGAWGDYVFPSVLVALAWLGGYVVRSQNDLVQRSRRGAAALERSIEVRAEAAATEERMRLARDVHDVLAHTLMLMVVQAGGARRSIESGHAGAEGALRVVEETGQDAATELRRLLTLVSPQCEPLREEADAMPGLADLPSLVGRAQHAGLSARLVIEGEPVTVPSGVALAAYRVAQEAVTNVIRHADATLVHLTLQFSPGELRLEVRDDGRCATNVSPGSGNGLTGMRERTSIYNGRLGAGPVSGGGEGYVVSATFPLVPSVHRSPA